MILFISGSVSLIQQHLLALPDFACVSSLGAIQPSIRPLPIRPKILHPKIGPWLLLHPTSRMIPREDGQGTEHWCALQDVQTPFVVKRIPVDSEGKFDDTVDRADLHVHTMSQRLRNRVHPEGAVTDLDEEAGDPRPQNHLLHTRIESSLLISLHPRHESPHKEQEDGERRQLQCQSNEQYIRSDIFEVAFPIA